MSADVSINMLSRLIVVRVNENRSNFRYLHSIALNARAKYSVVKKIAKTIRASYCGCVKIAIIIKSNQNCHAAGLVGVP